MNLDATVRYLTTTGKKKRYVTTYKNNSDGRSLRAYHKYFINYLNDNNYEDINSQYAYAYLKNKSPKTLVTNHINNEYFLCLDIKSFFESIDLEILKEKSNFLVSKNFSKQKLDDLIDSCKVPKKDNGLAIGLIPSALFSNIYLEEFDKSINDFLNTINENFIYTRYSDDIFISLNNSFDYKLIISQVTKLLKDLNLTIHNDKTRYKELLKKDDHIKMLGLNIVKGKDTNYVTVSRKYKRNTKREKNKNVKKGMNNYISYNEITNML